MARRQRTLRKPLILFGEGPTEELFLGLIKSHYASELAGKAITLGNGEGGSPGSILLALKKQILNVGAPSTPALALIDADKGLDDAAKEILKEHPNIQVVFSRPECVEGLMLALLGDLPPPHQQTAEQLKHRFQDRHLEARRKVIFLFKHKRAELFPRELFESQKKSNPVLLDVFRFLDLP